LRVPSRPANGRSTRWNGRGIALRKAYVSASPTNQLGRGATVLYFRSRDLSGVTVVGVVDDVLTTASPEAVVRFVGGRTV